MPINGIDINFVNANGIFCNQRIKHPDIRLNNIRGILGLADTRVNLNQHKQLSKLHNKACVIGETKQRFFSTSTDILQPHKFGGCAIFFG